MVLNQYLKDFFKSVTKFGRICSRLFTNLKKFIGIQKHRVTCIEKRKNRAINKSKFGKVTKKSFNLLIYLIT